MSPQEVTVVSRRTLLGAARIVFSLAVVAAIVQATASQWSGVRVYLTTLAWPYVVLAIVAGLAALGTATMAWRSALASVGHVVPAHTAASVYLGGMLAKYVPGSLWAFLLQMELGKRARLPRSAVLLASLVMMGVDSTVALLAGLVVAPALLEANRPLAVATFVLAPIAVVLAQPRLLTWLLRLLLRLLRQDPTQVPLLTWPAVLRVAGWTVPMWLLFGANLWLLAPPAATLSLRGYLVCVGAMALGQTVGMLAFLVPSGLGAREAVIVVVLAPLTSAPTALGIALASRLLLVVADALSGGTAVGVFLARRRAKRAHPAGRDAAARSAPLPTSAES